MSYEVYKILHIIGILFLFIGLAAVMVLSYAGQLGNKKARIFGFATHGIGLFIIFVTGFGLMARLGYFANIPGWAYAKIGIWFLAALAISLLKRKGQMLFANLLLIVLLGGTAAFLAITKPF